MKRLPFIQQSLLLSAIFGLIAIAPLAPASAQITYNKRQSKKLIRAFEKQIKDNAFEDAMNKFTHDQCSISPNLKAKYKGRLLQIEKVLQETQERYDWHAEMMRKYQDAFEKGHYFYTFAMLDLEMDASQANQKTMAAYNELKPQVMEAYDKWEKANAHFLVRQAYLESGKYEQLYYLLKDSIHSTLYLNQQNVDLFQGMLVKLILQQPDMQGLSEKDVASAVKFSAVRNEIIIKKGQLEHIRQEKIHSGKAYKLPPKIMPKYRRLLLPKPKQRTG